MGKVKKAVKAVRKKAVAAGAGIRRAAGKAQEAVKQFTAWSYSRYKDHRECPRQAYWKHILKKPQGPKSPAMQRGGDIHKEGEDYLNGKSSKTGKKIAPSAVPLSFKTFAKELRELRDAKAIAEGKWAMTREWKVTDYFNWAGAWVRLVLDAHHLLKKRARVIDFKTGKIYLEDNLEQVELYAIGALETYDMADEAQVELWYLDQPRVPPGKPGENPLIRVYTRPQVAKLRGTWSKKVVPILMDKRFVPNPAGWRCARCDYSKRKGGDCEF